MKVRLPGQHPPLSHQTHHAMYQNLSQNQPLLGKLEDESLTDCSTQGKQKTMLTNLLPISFLACIPSLFELNVPTRKDIPLLFFASFTTESFSEEVVVSPEIQIRSF
jgi:hypothetical protein